MNGDWALLPLYWRIRFANKIPASENTDNPHVFAKCGLCVASCPWFWRSRRKEKHLPPWTEILVEASWWLRKRIKKKRKTTERKCAWCPIVIILTVRRIYFRRQKVGAEDGGSGWVERERPRGLGQGKGETVGGHRTHVSPPAPPPLSCPHSLYWNFYLKALCHFFHKKFFLFFSLLYRGGQRRQVTLLTIKKWNKNLNPILHQRGYVQCVSRLQKIS